MKRILAAAVIGLLSGIAATLLVLSNGAPGGDEPLVRDLDDVPKMTPTAAAKHRRSRYEALDSIEEVLALPSDFAQTEALYALAGRSDAGTVQHLIFEANRIRGAADRDAALRILFARLAEQDPRSALALARSDAIAGNRELEARVWQSWAKHDLDASLDAVNAEPDRMRRNRAAQSLFAAHGYLGNATTDRIEAELGVRPDDFVRTRYLRDLADRSVAGAIDYINGLPTSEQRTGNARQLAAYLVRTDPEGAAARAEQFDDAGAREVYRRAVSSGRLAAQPEEAIEALLTGDATRESLSQLMMAMGTLARNDLESALDYFDRFESQQKRELVGQVIAREFARRDPARAVAWAKAQDAAGESQMLALVATQIAATDPEFALSHAAGIEHAGSRSQTIAGIVTTMASNDAARAASHLGRIEDRHQRDSAAGMVLSQWVQTDPDAAIDWALSNEAVNTDRLLQRAGMHLVQTDIDAAMRLLPRLGERQAARWRLQIAQQLAGRRSVADALSFVSRYEGTDGYDRLKAAVAVGVAAYDVATARTIAEQLPAGARRDGAYATLIRNHAGRDPEQAAAWLSAVSEGEQRDNATAMLVSQWNHVDQGAALRWVGTLPRGSQRDHAIAALAGSWQEPTPARRNMIESITDDTTRARAWMGLVGAVARHDASGARRLLEEADIPERQRQQLARMIDRHGQY